MENPYAPPRRARNDAPPPRTLFQRELDAKMRDRRARGLAAEITPDPSMHDSEDELGSDDGRYYMGPAIESLTDWQDISAS